MVSRGTCLRQEGTDGIALVEELFEHADAIVRHGVRSSVLHP